MGDAAFQAQALEVFVDGQLATPAGVAAGQVGLAVAVGVKQLGDLGILELHDVGDLVFVSRGLVDQITLRGIGGKHAFAVEHLGAAVAVVKPLVQRNPVVGHEGGIALGHHHVFGTIFEALGGFDAVAQLFECARNDQGLEHFFIDGAQERECVHALAR
ncbi:hypothetical protein D3C72_1785350 [compost metagenome]